MSPKNVILILFVSTIIVGMLFDGGAAKVTGMGVAGTSLETSDANYFLTFSSSITDKDLAKVSDYGTIRFTYNHLLMMSVSITQSNLYTLLKDYPRIIEARVVHNLNISSWEERMGDGRTEETSWGYDIIGAQTSVKKIGILDTGLQANNEDFAVANIKCVPIISFSCNDYNGQGTHIAGIISAQHNLIGSRGIATNANISIYKVCDVNGVCPEDAVLKGFEEADEDIILFTMSSDTKLHPLFRKEILRKSVLKSIIIAPAGNKKSVGYPAGYDFVIGVGALQEDGSSAPWSSLKSDIFAPGTNIFSTSNYGYSYRSGDSIAAAHIAAIASAIDASPLETQNILKLTKFSPAYVYH